MSLFSDFYSYEKLESNLKFCFTLSLDFTRPTKHFRFAEVRSLRFIYLTIFTGTSGLRQNREEFLTIRASLRKTTLQISLIPTSIHGATTGTDGFKMHQRQQEKHLQPRSKHSANVRCKYFGDEVERGEANKITHLPPAHRPSRQFSNVKAPTAPHVIRQSSCHEGSPCSQSALVLGRTMTKHTTLHEGRK